MNHFYPLEEQVMQQLLTGDDERLEILREQSKFATVKERKMTGVGFFLHFDIPANIPRLSGHPDLLIDRGLTAKIEGLNYEAGFVLWVADGAIDQLEGYSVAEDWPEHVSKFKLESTKPLSITER